MNRLTLLLLLAVGLTMSACSSMQKTSVSRVPAAALIVGRDGGVILVHKSQNGMYAIRQCEDFVPVSKEQDCRLVPGTQVREVTKQQIVAEISSILQLPRFKPEISKVASRTKRAEQMKLFRCADQLSMLNYEIYRRQKFGDTYGFFKEDFETLEKLLETSSKVSCSKKGIEKIQSEIDLVNKAVIDNLVKMIESDKLHIISSPNVTQTGKTMVPLENEIADSLSHVRLDDQMAPITESWELLMDGGGIMHITFAAALKACADSGRRLVTAAEIAEYASTKGAIFQDYHEVKKEGVLPEGSRISTIEFDSEVSFLKGPGNRKFGEDIKRYYKFGYSPGKFHYPRTENNFLKPGVVTVWTSSLSAEGEGDNVYHFTPWDPWDGGRLIAGGVGLEPKRAVVCTSAPDRFSFGQ